MRKILVSLTLVLIIFIVAYRQRIYLRDPLAVFYRNEVKQPGMLIFINYSNDVLVESSDPSHTQQYLIQDWDGVPAKPAELPCLQNLVCFAADNRAHMESWSGAKKAIMTNRQVTFKDGDDTAVRITLR